MPGTEPPAGTIDHQDTGGTGPVVLLLHGLLMDGTLWDAVVPDLAGHRCVVPTLPLGAHRRPVPAGTDLSLPGVARLVTDLMERLDLRDVTLVGNDTGGAVAQLIAGDPAAAARVSRLVLVSCEAFDNLPPGLTGRTLALTARLPPAAFRLFMQQLRLRPVRRLPLAFGWLTKRGDATTARWIRPVLSVPGIAGDTVRALRAAFADRDLLVRAARALPSFDRPALVVWAAGDRVMPPAHGRRLAELLPRGRHVEVPDSYTLVPLDQPARLATLIREFAGA